MGERDPAVANRASGRAYRLFRYLHLYLGLFVSPFILLFSISVFYLVHACLPQAKASSGPRVVSDVPIPPELEKLSGRARIDALRPALDKAGVYGEVGWVQHQQREQRLVLPVTVPGQVTTVTIDIARREASVQERTTGLADALVMLHKSPGPHLVGMRMNWLWMKSWSWLADATVYLILGVTVTGIYLWYALRAERKIGLALITAGAVTCVGLAYAIVH